ncbi:C2 domain-containing protein [Syncephalastrum racemosum]|uniref:C2 domain-containing protein n=1 Tax=Syncephalastrum racemosum TaxID=13706 RepID=A0A1X2GYS7_SYNRA|nr:C2 domain-containing protein [Syncephalastrum racemosum]
MNKLETDIESADWINHFVSRFWLIYEPVLSAQIIGIADAILIESTPSFLDSIRLSTFTLGTKPFKIEGIKTYPRTEPNVVCMDWKVSFVPNDLLDLTHRDLQSKVNPKIVLTIRVGKGMIGAGMPVLLEDLAFSGNLRLKFKLFNEFPHVKTVEASFLDKPQFDYSLKPVGGETFGFDINNIPGLQTFVQEQVHATLGPMMYAPNVYTVDVAGMMAGTTDLTSANGILAITIYSASNLKAADLFGSLDPYITFHIGNVQNAEQGRTSAFEDTSNPKWDETHFILLNNLHDTLFLQVMDRNSGRKDAAVGAANFDLKQVEESNNAVEGLNLTVMRGGKPVGEIKCDMRYFPVSKPDKKEDGTIVPPAESNSGILRFTVHECKQLNGDGKRSSGINLPVPIIGSKEDINAYAVIKINGQERLKTKAFKRSFNPRWDKFVEVFVADKSKLDLGVNIMNSNDFTDDDTLARWRMSLLDFEDQHMRQGMDWWNLKDCPGQIHLSAMWKPVVMTGFAEGLGHGSYRPPIGTVRIHFHRAKDLKNVEAMTGGKSDPYVRVMSGMQVRGQSDWIPDNLDPEWDTVLYVPVHSIREDLIFEVMDYNDIQKDKTLGLCDFLLKDIVKESKTPEGQTFYEPLDAIENRARKARIASNHGVIYPTLELPQPPKKEEENAEGGETKEEEKTEEETKTQEEEQEPLPEKDLHNEVVKMTPDRRKVDLLAYESGILQVTVYQAKLPERQKVTADILLDSNDPQYRTVQLKGLDLPFNETGDAFVREMDFSKVIVRIKAVKESDKDDSYVGFWTASVRDIVRKLMERTPEENAEGEVFKLIECDGGTIHLGFGFIPAVNFKLDPKESLENQGNLTVTPIRAKDLKVADRSGMSDPFVVFHVDGVKVHKTEVYKKDLNPTFKDEVFTVPVKTRVGAKLTAEVYDWDQIGKDTLLGRAETTFDGNIVESFAAKDVELALEGGGTLRLRLLWQPQLLLRKRTGTSLLGSTTRIFTHAPGAAFGVGKTFAGDVVGAGFGAGGKVFNSGGKIVGGGVSALGSGIRGIGRLGRKDKSSDASSDASCGGVIPPQPQPSQSSTINSEHRTSVDSTQPRSSTATEGNGAGQATVNVTLVGARNLKAMDKSGTSDPYVRVRVGSKVLLKTKHIKKTLAPEWNESFSTRVHNRAGVLDILVKDHNTLNDVDIGGCNVDVFQVLGSQSSYDGWVPLEPRGTGEVHVRVDLLPDSDNGSNGRGGLLGKII